jgi:hypothetical protein
MVVMMIRQIVDPVSYGSKEAQSLIKIDNLLEEAGCLFEPNEKDIAISRNVAVTYQENF